ncbi:MAG: lasso peptide biosynthesis B2 protein [Caldilineaceae bacterium]
MVWHPVAGDACRNFAWAVRAVSPHTRWQSNCYPQALAAKLLRRKQIPSTLYLGATIRPNINVQAAATSAMAAHAWLRCGPLYVTGGRDQDTYAVLAIFGA